MKKKKTIVILSGKKQTGKDTLAQYFVQDGFFHFAFADNLKLHLQQFLHQQFRTLLPINSFYDNTQKEKENIYFICSDNSPYSIRDLMQWYGEVIKQKFGLLYWVKRVALDIIENERDKVVISDARYDFEIAGIKQFLNDYNIKTILIERDTNFVDSHSSEQGINKKLFDYIISNNKGLKELKEHYKKIKSQL